MPKFQEFTSYHALQKSFKGQTKLMGFTAHTCITYCQKKTGQSFQRGSLWTVRAGEGTLFVQRYQPYLIQRATLLWPFFPCDALLIICNYFHDQNAS